MRWATTVARPARRCRGAAPVRRYSIPSWRGIGRLVGTLGGEHAAHVFARLGKRDLAHGEAPAFRVRLRNPFIDVRQAAVVGRQREHLVAGVVVEQVAR